MTTKIKANNIDLTTLASSELSTPKVSSLQYPGDDLATDTAGGGTITLNGSGFVNGCSVLIDTTYASVVSFANSQSISFTAPANTAGVYTVYVVNPDGGTAIVLPGLTYSGVPGFVTGAGSLGSQYETLSFSANIEATGDAPITYAITNGSLPSGLSLNSSTGAITGNLSIIAALTVYNFTVTASDAELQDVSRTFNITVNPDVVTWSSPVNNTTITQYETLGVTQTLDASSYLGKSITFTANALPGNLSISGNTITGNLAAGATNTTSLITATSATTNKTATRTLIFSVSPDVVTWNSPANGITISQYESSSVSQALSASSYLGFGVSYSANSLPSGISISGSNITGTLPGTVTTANSTSLITATSATTNRTATRIINFSINPDVVTWSSPSEGQAYSYTEGNSVNIALSAASAAGRSISYSATGLPSGLSISGSSITGTVSAVGSFSATLTATAATTGKTATRSISFTIASAVTDAAYTSAGTYSFTVPAGVTSISAVAVGSGSGGAKWASGTGIATDGGQGGDLRYGTIAVTPGEVLTVVVGAAVSTSASSSSIKLGNHSSISRGATVLLRGQGGGYRQINSQELSVGTGGNGGWGGWANSGNGYSGGGGGAGGYSGNGGWGGTTYGNYSLAQVQAQGFPTSAIVAGNFIDDYGKFGQNGSGGGGGGGGFGASGGGGGGVGILGEGASGTGGRCTFTSTGTNEYTNPTEVGTGGSGGGSGQAAYGDYDTQGSTNKRGNAGGYGGGAGGYLNIQPLSGTVAQSGGGAVRIVWGGKYYPNNAV